MKLTNDQIKMIEKLKTEFLIKVIDYGFYTDGSIGVKCTDKDGTFKVNVDTNGIIIIK